MHLHNLFDTDDETGFIYRWFLRKRDQILTDNVVFFLHYHVTSALFLVGCLIVTVGMFIMDPIDCITDKAVDDVIDNYCLYHSTYTVTSGDLGNSKNYLVAHPGIAATATSSNRFSRDKKFHRYYLWVALMLIIQGSSFYIPRGIWKHWAGSRVNTILNQKDKAFSTVNEESSTKQLRSLSLFILSKSHHTYYWKLLFCECLNLLNAFSQLSLMNFFLGFGLSRENFWYNKDILQLFKEVGPFQRSESVDQIFPKISTCTFYSYGPSGSVVNYQAICVLPINAINEKIYVALYVWLLVLICISILAIVYRLLIILPMVRNGLLKVHLRSEELATFSLSKLRKHLRIGNWQLLLQLTGNSNMDSWELTKIVKDLCRMCETMEN